MTRIKYTLITLVALLPGSRLFAQSNVVTTAVPFLRISSDTRGSGMGATGIATVPDVNAVYWNTGKLPFTKSRGAINANYSSWLKEWSNDMYITSLAGYYKINANETIHGLVRYLNPGDVQFTDNNGNHLQSYHPYEMAFDLGYARKLSEKIGLGLTVKYIRSDLAKGVQNGESFKAGNAVAADLGFFYDLRKNENGWSFGMQLSNLGSKISYIKNNDQKDFIPANMGLGASFTKAFDEQNRFTIAMDINKLLVPTVLEGDSVAVNSFRNKSVVGSWFSSFSDAPGGMREELKEFQIAAGAEYCYNDQFSIRGGYFFEDRSKGDRRYFSLGAGVSYNIFVVNFSYLIPSSNGNRINPLANTLQFGVTINLKNN